MIIKKKREAPENDGKARLIAEMKRHLWKVHKLNVSAGIYSTPGFPDLYATHKVHGQRWIETKVEDGYVRRTQIDKFLEFAAHDIGVWVLFDERDYPKLFEPCNWGKFLWKP